MHTDIDNSIDFVRYFYIHIADQIRMDMHRKNDVPLSLTQRAVKQLRCGQIIIRTGRIGMCQRQNSLTCISHAGVRPEVLNRRKLICGKAIIRDSAVRPMRTERRRGEIRERNRLQLFSRDRVRRRSDLPGCRRAAAGSRRSGDQIDRTLRRPLHRLEHHPIRWRSSDRIKMLDLSA